MLRIKAISLFSGIGAFELAAKWVFGDAYGGLRLHYQTFQLVEIDVNAQKVLRRQFPHIPIWNDIKTYHPPAPGKLGFPTVVVGGFPCTDTSNAGKRKGLAGSESGLWWEMYRVILECQPDFVIIENPEGIVHRGLRTILGALRMAGYSTEVELISAAELGAPHRRSRIFIIAHSDLLTIQSRKGWKCWTESVRDDIKTAREIGARLQVKPGSVCLDNGVSRWLDGINFDGWWKDNAPPVNVGIKPRTAGRRVCVNLYGRSIVPLQAAIALLRLQFLFSLI